ncbi:MAG: hypothetical protein U5N21_04850 [Rhodococcus sp. (in: high G+C Gram-positive bacteria)]|nr:hypothetical protein [Rhodococcus sp. (in: high G+C Gram-positive bacteria)]
MSTYDVEVVAAPIENGDWSALRQVTDLVPGALLIEDPVEPMLVLPVDADSQGRAFLFVDGILKLVGIEPLKGSITLAEDDDFELGDAPETSSYISAENETVIGEPAEVGRVRNWVNNVPPSPILC